MSHLNEARTNMKKIAAAGGEPPSRLIDARIEELGDWRGKTLSRVRVLIKQADPEVVEEWKWRGPVWSHDGQICTGETYKSVVKLTFLKGASLDDPSGLFNASREGNARRAIDLHEGDEIDENAFMTLIRAAVAPNGSSARWSNAVERHVGGLGSSASSLSPLPPRSSAIDEDDFGRRARAQGVNLCRAYKLNELVGFFRGDDELDHHRKRFGQFEEALLVNDAVPAVAGHREEGGPAVDVDLLGPGEQPLEQEFLAMLARLMDIEAKRNCIHDGLRARQGERVA
jgi:hypothetical protein